jgi:hypothetical protein
MASLYSNANSPLRQVHYEPLATVSRGYDSPACAILAREIGCTEAVTFVKGRQEHAWAVSDNDDKGTAIAALLNLDVSEYSREDYLYAAGFPEAEFLATGNGGDDIVMSVIGERLYGKLFFTGFRGDTVWDLSVKVTEESQYFKTKDPSGASLGEFRLRIGFIHVPVPALTFTRHADLYQIGMSDEMRPWRLGNNYDRPIPRRLIESKGVVREMFGQEKRAITQPFWIDKDNKAMFGKDSYEDLMQYTEKMHDKKTIRVDLQRRWADLLLAVFWRGSPLFDKLKIRFPLSQKLILSGSCYRVHWAVEKLMPRYQITRLNDGA